MNSFKYYSNFLLIISILLILILFYSNKYLRNNSIQKTIQSPYKLKLHNLTNQQIKYVRFECVSNVCGGWSDRIDGILSSFAFALIQKRKFLIRITQPCLINDLLEPNLIEWNETVNLNAHNLYAIDGHEFIKQLKTIDLNNHLIENQLITINNNQDWLKSISKNENVRQRIEELGYEPDKFKNSFLMKEWYSLLFKLKPHMEEKYQLFLKKAKPNKDTKLICAQMRLGGVRKNHASDWKFNDLDDVKLIFKFIRDEFLVQFKMKNSYKIFITTDDETAQENAIQEFGADNVVINMGDIVHIDRDVSNLKDCKKIEKTILDFHSLQNCDMAVITGSGFGKLGLWNRPNPIENLYLYSSKQFMKFNESDFFYTT